MEQASHRQVERTGHCITILSTSTSMIDSAINFRFNVSQCYQFQLLSPMQPTSRWNNRNGWRDLERRVYCLEGRSTQGRCRQEGEARLRQGISWDMIVQRQGWVRCTFTWREKMTNYIPCPFFNSFSGHQFTISHNLGRRGLLKHNACLCLSKTSNMISFLGRAQKRTCKINSVN